MSDLTDVPEERVNSPAHQEWLKQRKLQPACDPQPIPKKRKAHRCPECNCAAGRHTNLCSKSKTRNMGCGGLAERKRQPPCDPRPINNSGCGAPCEAPCTCGEEEDRRYESWAAPLSKSTK